MSSNQYSDFRPGDLAVCVAEMNGSAPNGGAWGNRGGIAPGMVFTVSGVSPPPDGMHPPPGCRGFDILNFAEKPHEGFPDHGGWNSLAFRRLLRKSEIEEQRKTKAAPAAPETIQEKAPQ